MDLKEKSLQYAESKLAEILNNVVAQAYIDGYNEACKENGKEVATCVVDGIEYVDLGLPSGTLWATDYLRKDGEIEYMPYMQAEKLSIPTVEQIEELINCCDFNIPSGGLIDIIGITGEILHLEESGYYKGTEKVDGDCMYFWGKPESQKYGNAFYKYLGPNSSSNPSITERFKGYKLPMLLVKNP